MKILVTGAKGFLGKNLVCALRNKGYDDIFEYDIDSSEKLLQVYCSECDFVFHLAGVNRPMSEDEFVVGNQNFTQKLMDFLMLGKSCPVLFSSSIQAELDNNYGKSKLEAEKIIKEYSIKTGCKSYIYRLPNVFGKWCKPNYNSAIATFCYNVANDLPILVTDEDRIMNLVYIDDVVREFINCFEGKNNDISEFQKIEICYTEKLGRIADIIRKFSNVTTEFLIPNLENELVKKLYSTYLSYLPESKLKYCLKMNCDNRGSFTEFIKTDANGQISVNIIKPNIAKGNHWHDSKNEIFLVVSGEVVIRLREIESNSVKEIYVTDKKLEPVIIPPGYTHNIQNIGDKDAVVLIWVNEFYDKNNPDTYYLQV